MKTRCGYVGIVGRPNVGKSTLLNYLVGIKVSITSSKPQTTREQILGIYTTDDTQYVFIDSPGLQATPTKYSNRLMNRAAKATLEDGDVTLWVVDSQHFSDNDENILDQIKKIDKPVVVALNKTDQAKEDELFALAERLSRELPNAEVVPCSAKTQYNLDRLLHVLREKLPQQAFMYPNDQVTDRNPKFYAAEILREKIMRNTGEEIPYACTVEIDTYEVTPKLTTVHATIWVDKESHKGIIVGKGGERLKEIGTEARLDLEKFWDQKIFLKLWVKVKKAGFVVPNA